LSDEWVAENSEWTSAEEMREAILVQMRRRKIVEAQMSQRDAALIALSELVAEDVAPEVLINAETNERLHDLGERLGAQKLTLEMFLQVTNQSPEDLLATLRHDAVRAVRVDLAMRALVAAEHLEATPEEIDEELERTAEAMGVSADLLRDNLRDSGRVVSFTAEVSKMKASKWLIENVVYVDPEGVEIDHAMLRADQSVEADESESEAAETDDDGAEVTDADA
jgi:trigger factor